MIPADATSTPAPAPVVVPAVAASTTAPPAAAPVVPAVPVVPVVAAPAPAPADPAKPVEAKKAESKTEDAPAGMLKRPPEKTEAEASPEAKAVTAPVEVKVPEGTVVNTAIVDEFKTLAQTMGLDSAKAQQIFDLGLKMQESFVADADRLMTKFVGDSTTALKKEWGPQFDSNVAAAQRVLTKFGDPKIFDELNGMENSPAVMRTLAAIGRAIGEDTIAIPGAQSAPPPDSKNRTGDKAIDAMIDMYPSMRKE
jgi:hypothetical protein